MTEHAPSRAGRASKPVLAIVAVGMATAAAVGGVAGSLITSRSAGSTTTTVVTARDASPNVASDVKTANGRAGMGPVQLYRKDSAGVVTVLAKEAQGLAEGSGVVLDRSGYILTNDHVVAGSTAVKVSFENNVSTPAQVVGKDPSTDLALLKVSVAPSQLHPLPLGSSSSLVVGQPVVAIGNPFGLQRTITAGIVSALGRDIQSPNGYTIPNAIQTDAAINHGNSGGPLIDSHGDVIGINSQIAASGVDGNVGIGFAIPIDLAKTIAGELRTSGSATHAWLGIEGETITPDMAKTLRLPTTTGVLVAGVVPTSPAANAGLVAGHTPASVSGVSVCLGGDVITKVDGHTVTTIDQLRGLFSTRHVGDHVTLGVVHGDGSAASVAITLANLPAHPPKSTVGCK